MADTTETKKIRKLIWEWDFDKAENWFNEMAAEGWVLQKPGKLTYQFRRCEPGEYTVRLEMHDHSDKDYIRFLEESGAEYLGTDWQFIYLRKKSDAGPFDLFSDIDSRVAHLNRIGRNMFSVGILNIAIGVVNVLLHTSDSFGWVYLINLLIAMPLMYGLGRIHGKKEVLEKERQLHE